MLLRQQPEEAVNNLETDSFAVAKGKSLVVAGIRDSSETTVSTRFWGARWPRKTTPLAGRESGNC